MALKRRRFGVFFFVGDLTNAASMRLKRRIYRIKKLHSNASFSMLSLGYDALSTKTVVQVALDTGGVFIKESLA
jgi:hypothetical protein